MSERPDSDVLMDAVLRPSPPLAPKVLRAILGVVAAINLAFGSTFILRGAWPVMPFLGADVLLLAWAFRASTIAARREEHLTLTPSLLSVARRPAQPNRPDIALNPYWVRVDMPEPPEHGSQLTLWSHGKGVRIGTFLAPTERAAFARRLKEAVWRARTLQH